MRAKLSLYYWYLTLTCLALIEPARSAAESSLWNTWKDHRPIGQLFFSGGFKPSAANPGAYLSADYDIRTRSGLAQLQTDLVRRAVDSAANIKRANGQGVIIWDIEGSGCGHSNPGNGPVYYGDPRVLPSVSPEMDAVADRIFQVFKFKGLKVGVCIRAQRITYTMDDLHRPQDQVQYSDIATQLQQLDAKINYAHRRWGCTIFYVDSNQAPVSEPNNQHGGITPVQVYQTLFKRHPDCLFIPEQYYGPYLTVTAPYGALHVFRPGVGGDIDVATAERAAYPHAFRVIFVNDGDTRGNMSALINSARYGTIYGFRAWFWSEEIDQVIRIYRAAAELDKR